MTDTLAKQDTTELAVQIPAVTTETVKEFLFSSGTKLTDQEFAMFLNIAVRNQLDPFKREIYAVKYSGKMDLLTGYEVYLRRGEATGLLNGWATSFRREGNDTVCQITIHRKDWAKPFIHEVYLSEYDSGKSLWKSKKRTMLKKTCVSQGFRLCFPSACAGLPYTGDEMKAGMGDDDTIDAYYADPRPAAFQALADAMQASGVNKTTMLGYAKETFGVGSAAELEADQLTQCAEWASKWTAPAAEPEPTNMVTVDTLNLLAEAMKVNGVTVPGLHAQMEKAFGEGNTNPRDRTEDEIADLIQWCDDMGADNEETTTND